MFVDADVFAALCAGLLVAVWVWLYVLLRRRGATPPGPSTAEPRKEG